MMPSIKLLTWNLKKKDEPLAMIEDYIRLLRGPKKRYIVALQESPDSVNAILGRVGGYGIGNGGILLLSSENLTPTCTNHLRFVAGELRFSGQDVVVFSYHGHSKMDHMIPEARGGYSSEYRWHIENIAGHRQFLVMGDFNAEPKEGEISHKACFSMRSVMDIDDLALSSHGKTRCDIRILAPEGKTMIYKPSNDATKEVTYDYMAATLPLAREIQTPRVIKELGGRDLTTKEGRPGVSDHFPVMTNWTKQGDQYREQHRAF